MIQIILGKQGTGKTKRLIDMANKAAQEDNGEIVFIDSSSHHMMELEHSIRFVNSDDFKVNNPKVFYGFLSGIIAGNYDIDLIYIDGLLKIIDTQVDYVQEFLYNLKKLSAKFNVRFVITMSGDPKTIPDFLQDYVA